MPVGQMTPMQRQRAGKAAIDWLAKNLDKVRDKDRDFITSLSVQPNRFTDKQLSYIVGDEVGQNPKGFESLAKRYEAELKDVSAADLATAPRVLSQEDATRIMGMDVDEIEATLTHEWETVFESDMELFEKDPVCVFMRKVYLEKNGEG